MNLKTQFRTIIARRLERQVERLMQTKKPIIVAVTGSVGKTSTKLAIAHVLSSKYKVLAHAGNYNSEIGLPLSIFEHEVPKPLTNPLAWQKILSNINATLRRGDYPYDVLVLEMGADQPKDIKKFMRYITPDIGIVTAVAPVHLEQFKTIEAVFEEKWSLATGSKQAIVNAEDVRLMSKQDSLNPPALTYGLTHGDYKFQSLLFKGDGYGGQLDLSGDRVQVQTNLLAKHSLYALVAAAAVGHKLGLDPALIKDQLESWRPVSGRMNPLWGLKGSLIIDDTYNSSPEASIAALDTLAGLSGRHIAILGSMNELGNYSPEGHRRVGEHCHKLDFLITIGHDAELYLAPAAAKAGLNADQIKSFASPYEAGQYLAPLVEPNDKILAKGSQNGVFAEEAVKFLLADPADTSKLVRQSPEWLKRKQAQFSKPVEPATTVKINLPKRLFKNNIRLSKSYYNQVKTATDIERQWYAQTKPFKSLAGILAAEQTGRVAKIAATPNYLPILRFRNPELTAIYPPYLTSQSKGLLDEVSSAWRAQCVELGVDSQIRLAVTALLMTTAYRDQLLKAGKLAIDKGPHVLGEAFDIDGCGYYFGEAAVNPRPKTKKDFDKAFSEIKAYKESPEFQDYSSYDPRVHQILKSVLDEMMQAGKLHYLQEFPDSINTSFHVCRHPDYLPTLK